MPDARRPEAGHGRAASSGHGFLTVALGPILLVQGLWARMRLPRLPEAAGPRHGRQGRGPTLRLLILGDSAAAGVGAERQRDALSGCLVDALTPRFTVEWTLFARSGATTASTLDELSAREPADFDVAVTSLGVNDVVAGLGLDDWLRTQRALRSLLRERFRVSRLLVSGLPPVAGFPGLPQPLRWYLGRRARHFDDLLVDDVDSEGDVRYLGLGFVSDAGLMAEDGFHPGPEIYRAWARGLADLVD